MTGQESTVWRKRHDHLRAGTVRINQSQSSRSSRLFQSDLHAETGVVPFLPTGGDVSTPAGVARRQVWTAPSAGGSAGVMLQNKTDCFTFWSSRRFSRVLIIGRDNSDFMALKSFKGQKVKKKSYFKCFNLIRIFESFLFLHPAATK